MFPVQRLQNLCERSTFSHLPSSIRSRLFVVLNLDKVKGTGLKLCNIGFNFKICFENSMIYAFLLGLDIRIPFLHELHLKMTFNFSAKLIYIFYIITYPYIVQSNIL